MQFIDQVRAEHPQYQLVVLIPVVRPDKLRYRLLHNQIDLVLSTALRGREDVVVARVSMPLEAPLDPAPPVPPVLQRPFHTGSRFSMNAVAPSLASSLPNTLGCHSVASSRALARSVDAVRTSSLVARRASGPLRAMRSARDRAASSTSAGRTTWLISPNA